MTEILNRSQYTMFVRENYSFLSEVQAREICAQIGIEFSLLGETPLVVGTGLGLAIIDRRYVLGIVQVEIDS